MSFKNLKEYIAKKKERVGEIVENQKLRSQVKAEKTARKMEKHADFKQKLAERKVRQEQARQKSLKAQQDISAAQAKTRKMQPKQSFNFGGGAPSQGSLFGNLGAAPKESSSTFSIGGGGDMFAGSPFAAAPAQKRAPASRKPKRKRKK